MRILVYGAGVLGGNLANNFYRKGKDVTLLARGEWGDTIRKNGLIINHQYSLKKDVSQIPVIGELSPEDIYDVIFVVVRYTQLDSVIDVLNANGTRNIVLVGNNVRADYYAECLKGKNVMFAFSLLAGHRDKNQIVSMDFKRITIGQRKQDESNEKLINEIFSDMGYKVVYEPNMEDYLLCHAAFVIPAAFACYYTKGNLKRIRKTDSYLHKLITANIEGYRAIEKAGHEILPKSDVNYEDDKYRQKCFWFFKIICFTNLGKICASDHAMSATDEMSALNRDLKLFFEQNKASYRVWKSLEEHTNGYLEGVQDKK